MTKKVNKGLLEQMTSTEWFNYISALKQIEETISKIKDNVSENGDEDRTDGGDYSSDCVDDDDN